MTYNRKRKGIAHAFESEVQQDGNSKAKRVDHDKRIANESKLEEIAIPHLIVTELGLDII